MFPDISCDDIFRLETPRLWLRWLRISDAAILATMPHGDDVLWSGTERPDMGQPGEAERLILHARAANAAGDALVLGATTKSKARTLVGVAVARAAERGEIQVGCAILPGQTGRGFAGESLSALVDACFGLTETRALVARIGADAAAAGRVLERCGFARAPSDEAVRGGATGNGRHLYRRERAAWSRGRGRPLPGMPHQRRKAPNEPGGDPS